jgi:hypothetical protein
MTGFRRDRSRAGRAWNRIERGLQPPGSFISIFGVGIGKLNYLPGLVGVLKGVMRRSTLWG